jgi:oligopeptide transport system substrate-binding protein
MQMICLTNQGLMSFDKNGAVTYGVADSYKVSADGLTYTFHIRDSAYWNNGDKVTSKDFLFAWKRVSDPKTAAPCAFALGASGVKNGFAVAFGGAPIDTLGIAAPDDSTFIVTLDAPRSYFLYQCALASYLMPTNEKYFNSCGDQFGKDKDHYLSCGPYIFSDWEVGGTSYTLVKNDKFYDADKVT